MSPVSPGDWAVSRFSASCSGWACCPWREPNTMGNSHCMASPSGPKSCCMALMSSGPANTPPTQNATSGVGISRSGVSTVGSAVQNVDDGARGTTIPATISVMRFQAARVLDLRAADLHLRAQAQAELPGCLR